MTEKLALSFSNIWAMAIAFVRKSSETAQWDALCAFAIRALSAALLFFTQVALARWLGATDYGIYVSAWTFALVVGSFSSLGLGATFMKLAPMYRATGEFDKLRGVLTRGRLMGLGSSICVAGLAALGLSLMEGPLALSLGSPMMIALLCLPLCALSDVYDGLGRGCGWVVEATSPTYLLRPTLILCAMTIAHFAEVELTAFLAMTVTLLALTTSTSTQIFLVNRRFWSIVPKGRVEYSIPHWLSISMPLFVAALCEVVLQNADILILNLYRPHDEIGMYYAAAKTTTLALFVQFAMGTAFAGRLAAASSLDDKERVKSLVGEVVRWTFFPTAGMVLVLLALGYPILSQFGDEFTASYPLMFALSIGVLARSSMGPAEVILNMLGHHKASAKSYAIAAAACIGLNFLLIPQFGTMGAAFSMSIALVIAATCNWLAARQLLGLNIFILANLRR